MKLLKNFFDLFDRSIYKGKEYANSDLAFSDFPDLLLLETEEDKKFNILHEPFPLITKKSVSWMVYGSIFLISPRLALAVDEPTNLSDYIKSYGDKTAWSEYFRTGQTSFYHRDFMKKFVPIVVGASCVIGGLYFSYPMMSAHLASNTALKSKIKNLSMQLIIERDYSDRILNNSNALLKQLENRHESMKNLEAIIEFFLKSPACVKAANKKYQELRLLGKVPVFDAFLN